MKNVALKLFSSSLLSLTIAAGCASAPHAAPAPAPQALSPAAQQAGVSLAVSGVSAPGSRRDHTAVYVVIENQSPREISIAKEDFVLGTVDGARHAPLAPQAVAEAAGSRYRIVRATRFGASRFMPAPRGQRSPDSVIAASLPAGALQPGGRVAGYLYFPAAGAPKELGWQVRDRDGLPASELKLQLAGQEAADQ